MHYNGLDDTTIKPKRDNESGDFGCHLTFFAKLVILNEKMALLSHIFLVT